MRIVAGRWRGRRLDAPDGRLVRPTGDRVREAWMSVVHDLLPDALVLDLCAGSGALGIEALSRGAAHTDFVERHPAVRRVLARNLSVLDVPEDAFRVIAADAGTFVESLAEGAYDVAFADPPYADELAERIAERWLAVPFAAVLGIEHAAGRTMPAGGDTRRYGDTALTFYR